MANGTLAASQIEMLSLSGTGIITITPPATNTNRTLTLPDATGTVLSTATAGVPVNGPAVSAYQSSGQTLSSATFTKLLFQTEEWDTNSNFASSTFTPTVAGYYLIAGAMEIGASNTVLFLRMYKNGAAYKNFSGSSPSTFNAINGSAMVYCNGSTDYVELYGYVGTGQILEAQSKSTYFQAALVRSAV